MTVTSESTLKELVDETTVIKNDLVSCRDNLKTNLTNKGVNVAGTDKMQVLVDKVNEIEVHNFPMWYRHNIFIKCQEPTSGASEFEVAKVKNKIYLMGGIPSNTLRSSSYDTDTNTWDEKLTNVIDGGYDYMSTCAVGDNVYVLGGSEGMRISRSTRCYNTLTDTWSLKTQIPCVTGAARASSCSKNSKIYLIGGHTYVSGSSVYVKTNYCYDTITDTWSTKTEMPLIRYLSRSAYSDKDIYVVGGYDPHYSAPSYTSIFYYNDVTDSWSNKSSFNSYISYPTVCLVENVLHIFDKSFRHCYNISSNTWQTYIPTPTFRESASAINVDGRVYILCGVTSDGREFKQVDCLIF